MCSVNERIFVIGSMMCPYLVILKSSVKRIKLIKCLVEMSLSWKSVEKFILHPADVKQKQP